MHFLRQKCSPKNLVFSDLLFIAIFAEYANVTEYQCVMHGGHIRAFTYSLLFWSSTASLILAWKKFCKIAHRWTVILYFVVRARCRLKKFTFAVSSREELVRCVMHCFIATVRVPTRLLFVWFIIDFTINLTVNWTGDCIVIKCLSYTDSMTPQSPVKHNVSLSRAET